MRLLIDSTRIRFGLTLSLIGLLLIQPMLVLGASEDGVQLDPQQKLVVRLAPGASADKVAKEIGAEVSRRGPLNFATLEVSAGRETAAILGQLRGTKGVLGAEESRLLKTSALTVMDPFYSRQWSLVQGEVKPAWDMGAAGLGITIAIVDTGVDLTHPDLKANLVPGYNATIGSTLSGACQDDNGHGTHVAGIAAASLNSKGIVGVAYQAKIMPIKAMDVEGEGFDDAIADGIVWAADHGAKVINLSLGTEESSTILREAIAYAADKKGCLLVAASGNLEADDRSGVSYPASDPNVLAVTATDQEDDIVSYAITGPEVDLAAPGDEIVSTWQNGGYSLASGTSMAASFVSGAAADIWSAHPDWTRKQVTTVMEKGAKDLGMSGWDTSYGYGRIDLSMAFKVSDPPQLVQSEDPSTHATLSFPFQALGNQSTVTLLPVPLPGELPKGVILLSTPFKVDLEGVLFQEVATLTLSDARVAKEQDVALFRWNGARWISIGGFVSGDQVSLGIFLPGVYVLGTSLFDVTTERLAGLDAVGTSLQISRAAFPTGADTVIIATNANFPDALAGAPLANKYQAPILLAPSFGLTEEVRAELNRLKPQVIYLLGGTAVLNPGIEAELSALYEVKRVAGVTAYGTAEAIAKELGTRGRAVLVSGQNYPDALSIAPWAAKQGIPILLTRAATLPSETQKALQLLSVVETRVIGGEAVVSPEVMQQVPLPTRFSGWSQYDTSAAVLTAYPPLGQTIYLATGENYPDALTGAVLAAQGGSMLVTVPTSTPIPAGLVPLFGSWRGKAIVPLGGSGALPEVVVERVKGFMQ